MQYLCKSIQHEGKPEGALCPSQGKLPRREDERHHVSGTPRPACKTGSVWRLVRVLTARRVATRSQSHAGIQSHDVGRQGEDGRRRGRGVLSS